jgi:hypothetical protein
LTIVGDAGGGRGPAGGQEEGGDRAGRGAADAGEAQAGLLEHVGVAAEREAQHAAALEHEVDVLVAVVVDDVGVVGLAGLHVAHDPRGPRARR